MVWNIETRFQHHDDTHSVRTFMVQGRTMEQGLTRGRLLVRQHLAANRYKDAKIVRVYQNPPSKRILYPRG